MSDQRDGEVRGGQLGRRAFLTTLSGALVTSACAGDERLGPGPATSASQSSGPGSGGSGASSGGAPGVGGAGQGGSTSSAPLMCTETADNILGPYYRPGAPFITDLVDPSMPGVRLTVSGKVLDPDCNPVAGALIDVWQADSEGDYDNDGVDDPPAGAYVLRGRMYAEADGSYSFHTIIPGHYLNGAQYRPAHIHVTVSADGHETLTTQLYFEGDPYNDIDPFIIDSLVMPLTDAPGGEKAAAFDFVIAKLS